MSLEDAAQAEIPPLLVRPPWLDQAPPPPLPVVVGLSPFPFEPRVRMSKKEKSFYLAPHVSLADLRGYNLVPRHLEPQTPEMDAFVLARLQKDTRYGASYLDLLSAPVARAYLEEHGLRYLLADSEDVRHIVARFGEWTVPLLQRDPAAAVTLADLVESPRIAEQMVKPATKGRKDEREDALRYFKRYPEAAAIALLPLALAKKTQKAATKLLQVAASADLPAVQAVARRYGPTVVAALPALLAHEGPPRKPPALPSFADPARLPPVELGAAPGKRLPEGAVLHLLTLLVMGAGSEWPEAEAWILEAKAAAAPASLAAFAWALFQAWIDAGEKPGADFAMRALGWLGDDAAARDLGALVRAWPAKAAHARAVKGLEVLAAMDSLVALGEIDAIADRGGHRGIEERASALLDEIAARRGLSREELGDRLVPTLGLDPDGSRLLSFGPRTFRVGFDEHLSPFVRDEAGERRADLPEPRRTDDAALAGPATQAWRQLKKAARALASHQIRRLEAAMVSGRRWTARDLRERLVEHPLLHHLARRLVFGVFAEGRLTATFRVAEDRSLSGPEDAPFALADGASVGLVHRLDLSDGDAVRWSTIFTDYEIIQPFPQLGRDTYLVTEAEVGATSLTRFAGKVVATAGLVGLASQSWGADVGDGGNIRELRRTLPGDLFAELGFEDGYYVASLADSPPTQTLSPVVVRRQSWNGPAAPLGALSRVAFSELVRDVGSLRP